MPDEAESPSPSDAFQALGNERRMAILHSLATDGPKTFSALFEAVGEETTAGFAYHLRQLTGQFVRKRDDGVYELTYAGRAVARTIPSGAYTDRIDRDILELEDDCPFCSEATLEATVEDNVTHVQCHACDSSVLRLSFPPSGYHGRDESSFATAFDAHHRHRIEAFNDGVCPECGGVINAALEAVESTEETDPDHGDDDNEEHTPTQAVFDCETCGSSLRCPVSLTVLSHPAVVAFYHDHGLDIADRPLWNVGSEWRERIISRDPWCLGIRTRLDDDELLLYVARDGRVVDTRRRRVEGDVGNDAAEPVDTSEPHESGEPSEPSEASEPTEAGDDETGTDGVAA